MPEPQLALALDLTSPVPPFEQLRTRISGLVADGTLPPGAKLPTVRQLALDLGLAANTVAKTYRELEADGVIVTSGRRGTFVHSDTLHDSTPAELSRLAAEFATTARRAGLSSTEAVSLVERAWSSAPRSPHEGGPG